MGGDGAVLTGKGALAGLLVRWVWVMVADLFMLAMVVAQSFCDLDLRASPRGALWLDGLTDSDQLEGQSVEVERGD